MRIGICSAIPSEWRLAADLGYDFIEGQFAPIAMASEDAFAELLRAQQECGIGIEAYNCFFPSGFSIYAFDPQTGNADEEGFEAALARVRAFARTGMERAAKLGGELVVIGSSAVRSVPKGMKREVAREQFARVLRVCAEIGQQYGIIVTVEPLSPVETDFINTLSDSLSLLREVGHPNLRAMNDFYHSRIQNEPEESLTQAGELLVHVHIARADRDMPKSEEDISDLAPCIAQLRRIGYTGRISFEGNAKPSFAVCAEVSLRVAKKALAVTAAEA